MAKLSKDMEPQAAIRALLKLTTHEEIEAFMDGEKRKSIQKEAIARIAALSQASELPEMKIETGETTTATGPEGEQPLNGTSRPATKKEAKAIAEAAAANRPHKKGVAAINPKSSRERKHSRNLQVVAMSVEAFTEALMEEIDSIMEGHDQAFDISGNDEKFTYVVACPLRIVSENGVDFTCKVKPEWKVTRSVEKSRSFHLEDPDNDLVDMAEAKEGAV